MISKISMTIYAFQNAWEMTIIVILILGTLFVLVTLSFYLTLISMELKDVKWKKKSEFQ